MTAGSDGQESLQLTGDPEISGEHELLLSCLPRVAHGGYTPDWRRDRTPAGIVASRVFFVLDSLPIYWSATAYGRTSKGQTILRFQLKTIRMWLGNPIDETNHC